jgi:hypothetical protein
MVDNGRTYSVFELGQILAQEDSFVVYEPVYGDSDYDYGYADDGWPRPGPCPVCGAPDWTCVSDYYAELARAQIISNTIHD